MISLLQKSLNSPGLIMVELVLLATHESFLRWPFQSNKAQLLRQLYNMHESRLHKRGVASKSNFLELFDNRVKASACFFIACLFLFLFVNNVTWVQITHCPTLSLAAILWKSLDMHRRSWFLPTRDKAIDAHLSFLFHAYSFGLSDSMAVTTSFMPVWNPKTKQRIKIIKRPASSNTKLPV